MESFQASLDTLSPSHLPPSSSPTSTLLSSRGPGCPEPQSSSQCLAETQTSIHSSTPPTQASRPPERRRFPSFQEALAAPRYLILGCTRCSGSPRSPWGSSGPPLSQAGAGGAAPPRGAVGFSNTNTAPPLRPRPLLVVPPLLAPKSFLSGSAPPSAGPARLHAGAKQDAECRLRSFRCNVQSPASIPV